MGRNKRRNKNKFWLLLFTKSINKIKQNAT